MRACSIARTLTRVHTVGIYCGVNRRSLDGGRTELYCSFMTVVTAETTLSHVIAVYVHRMSVHKDCDPRLRASQRAPIARRQAVVIAVDVIVLLLQSILTVPVVL